MRYVDTHAHIFNADSPVVAGARYSPQQSASVESYISHLDQYGFDYGVLIQPSFLGYNNDQMLKAIAAYASRLKGIAVVPADSSLTDLQHLKNQGIVGARLNLFGLDVPDLTLPKWQLFLSHLAQLNWQLELHCPPAYLRQLMPALQSFTGPIVLDHFGRVDPEKGVDDADYQFVLQHLDPSRYWVKISAYYRLGQAEAAMKQAQQSFHLLLEHGMADRLVWGSDWPHTQHEEQVNYQKNVDFLQDLVQDLELEQAILGSNAMQLYGFGPS